MSKNRLQLGSLRCSSRLTSRINPNPYSTSLTVPSREIAGFTIVSASGMTRQRITASSGIGREVKDLWTYTLKRIKSVHRGDVPPTLRVHRKSSRSGYFSGFGTWVVSTNPWGPLPSLPSFLFPLSPFPSHKTVYYCLDIISIILTCS